MKIEAETRNEPVVGRNLFGVTLGEVLGDDPLLLLVFLRHLG